MEFRLKQWHRPLAGCGLVLLLAVLAGAWYADEAEKPPLVLQAGEAEKVVQEDSLAIRGLQEANEHKELRNPFSLLHETEQESEHMALPAKQPMENGKVRMDKPPAVSPATGNGSQMPVGNEQAISLCLPLCPNCKGYEETDYIFGADGTAYGGYAGRCPADEYQGFYGGCVCRLDYGSGRLGHGCH